MVIYIIVRSTHDIYNPHTFENIRLELPPHDGDDRYPLTIYVGRNVIDIYRFTPGHGDTPCNFHAVINVISYDIDFRTWAKLKSFFTQFIHTVLPSLPEHGVGVYDKHNRLIWFYAIYRFNNVNELYEFVRKASELIEKIKANEYDYDALNELEKLYAKHLVFLINATIPQNTLISFKYFVNGKVINNEFGGFEKFYRNYLAEYFDENAYVVKAVNYACRRDKIIYKSF